ncbi:hypothetical protein KIPE111705_25850 [Kibdelosporangium persicum]|nr:hypothetical protein [Kibdelosporangium persicum]
MLTERVITTLIDIATTVLILAALVITCAAMLPPRPPRGPRH